MLVLVPQRYLIVSWVNVSSRGKELPGNYNHVLISDLFLIQASKWKTIAGDHLETYSDAIEGFGTGRN